jgi:hypothetical protein
LQIGNNINSNSVWIFFISHCFFGTESGIGCFILLIHTNYVLNSFSVIYRDVNSTNFLNKNLSHLIMESDQKWNFEVVFSFIKCIFVLIRPVWLLKINFLKWKNITYQLLNKIYRHQILLKCQKRTVCELIKNLICNKVRQTTDQIGYSQTC